MRVNGNNYEAEGYKKFGASKIDEKIVKIAFNFAYGMTFGHEGEHQDKEFGEGDSRKQGEIFTATFQGKLAEYAIDTEFIDSNITSTRPDNHKSGLGEWDKIDFIAQEKLISIKSTKFYGKLLMLEKNKYDDDGYYKPNKIKYPDFVKSDYFILVRIKESCEDIMKSNKLFYSNQCEKDKLSKIIMEKQWSYDILGYITYDMFLDRINKAKQKNVDGSTPGVIPKNAMLNVKTKIKVDNYYFEINDMYPIEDLYKKLK